MTSCATLRMEGLRSRCTSLCRVLRSWAMHHRHRAPCRIPCARLCASVRQSMYACIRTGWSVDTLDITVLQLMQHTSGVTSHECATHRCTHKQGSTHASMCRHTHGCTHGCTHGRTHTHARAQPHTHPRARATTHTHARAHPHTPTRTRTHTHPRARATTHTHARVHPHTPHFTGRAFDTHPSCELLALMRRTNISSGSLAFSDNFQQFRIAGLPQW